MLTIHERISDSFAMEKMNLCYPMTVNKSCCQTLSSVGIYLSQAVFHQINLHCHLTSISLPNTRMIVIILSKEKG